MLRMRLPRTPLPTPIIKEDVTNEEAVLTKAAHLAHEVGVQLPLPSEDVPHGPLRAQRHWHQVLGLQESSSNSWFPPESVILSVVS